MVPLCAGCCVGDAVTHTRVAHHHSAVVPAAASPPPPPALVRLPPCGGGPPSWRVREAVRARCIQIAFKFELWCARARSGGGTKTSAPAPQAWVGHYQLRGCYYSGVAPPPPPFSHTRAGPARARVCMCAYLHMKLSVLIAQRSTSDDTRVHALPWPILVGGDLAGLGDI